MPNKVHEVAIIGGGIVGLATAKALLERCNSSLIILEAEDRIAVHQTGHNSGVIHSGLYYKPGSLKSQNCVDGRERLYQFCQEHGIAYEKCGKLVVATDESELPALAELEKRGKANGLQGIERLAAAQLPEVEPHVRGVAGLHVPETGIVDFKQVALVLADLLRAAGVEIRLQSKLIDVQLYADSLVLKTTSGEIACRQLINCGGLHADRIAKMCGQRPGLQIIPFRGEYYELVAAKSHLVKNLIYPVPDPRFPFLGVHFTRTISGPIEAGPNAVLACKREGYRRSDFSLRDMAQLLGYSGFWRMAARYAGMGLAEMYRSFSKRAFLRALQRLLPEVELNDIQPGGAGVRAQAVLPNGTMADDFRILQSERMIHVLNAPSPAATAALSIGETIAGRVSIRK